jgi:hypothetical protein
MTDVVIHVAGDMVLQVGGDTPVIIARLDDIITAINTKGDAILASEAELDQALAQLAIDVAEVKTDLDAAIARVEAAATAQSVDLTNEIQAVKDASSGLDQVSSSLQGVGTAPPTDTDPPDGPPPDDAATGTVVQ